MTKRQKQAVDLRQQGFSNTAIAKQLGISRNAALGLLQRARQAGVELAPEEPPLAEFLTFAQEQ